VNISEFRKKSIVSIIIMTKKKPLTKKKSLLTAHDKISIHDKVIRLIFGIMVFSGLVIGFTYYLQSTLLIYKGIGNAAHWGTILIILPALSGLLQHLIDPPARLFVTTIGSLLSSIILYYLYGDLWKDPPTITLTILFTFVIGAIGFTCSINPLDRHIHQRRTSRARKKSPEKNKAHSRRVTHKSISVEGMLNSSFIRTFELMLTILGFILAIWGTVAMN